MKRSFAALRFAEDKNISERVYWYLNEFPLKTGDRVLAPVGTHDRLQAAVVEKTLSVEQENAPYDLRLIKSVAAPCGARKLIAGGKEYLEFGGVRYDEKHYTRFGKILLAKDETMQSGELTAYGVTDFIDCTAENGELYDKIARARGCAVLAGKAGESAFRNLLHLTRGINKPLYDLGVGTETVRLLKEKLQ